MTDTYSTNIVFNDLCERLDFSLRKAAKFVGVTPTTINNWRNFVHPMSPDDLKKFKVATKKYLADHGLVYIEDYEEIMKKLDSNE